MTTAAPWTISTDPSILQLDRIHAWLSSTYWSPGIRREIVERAFAGSLPIGAYDPNGRQLAVARLVTDQATFGWLCDVFVDESVRGQGIAQAMIRTLLGDPRLQTLRRWCLATRDAHEVYRPLGFGPIDASRWMELKPPDDRWSHAHRCFG